MARHEDGVRCLHRTWTGRARTLTRRGVVSGALGLAGASALSAGLVRLGGDGAAAQDHAMACHTDEALREPALWRSRNGLLKAELIAQDDDARELGAVGYGGGGVGFAGLLPGPTLYLYPGDRLRLRLVNQLGTDPTQEARTTNIHVHGLHVTPVGHGDNVFAHVRAGELFDYEYQLPPEHPTGLYWYHPHFHGHAQVQVSKGLAGAIIIAEPDEPEDIKEELIRSGARNPGPAGQREHLLVLQHLDAPIISDNLIDPSLEVDARGCSRLRVNGQIRPQIAMAAQEQQRWRILNATADTFFNLSFGGLPWHRVASDGNWIPLTDAEDEPEEAVLALGPAERAEILITGGENASYQVVARWQKRSATQGARLAPVFTAAEDDVVHHLATITRDDAFVPSGVAETPVLFTPTDICAAEPLARRTITFSRITDVGGKPFNEGRVDQTIARNSREAWDLVNTLADIDGWHPIHLHVNDFIVESVSAGPTPQGKQDTVPLPPHDGADGKVVIRTCFSDFTGRFVYHCHFLTHEDKGMMAAVEVVEPVRITGGNLEPTTVSVTVDGGPLAHDEVNAGATVIWTNHDDAAYAVVADEVDPLTAAPRFSSGSGATQLLSKGRSFAHTFELPGVYAYHLADEDGQVIATGTVVVEAVKTVDLVDNVVFPDEIAIAPGTAVTWTNREVVNRSIESDEVDGAGVPLFASGPLASGGSPSGQSYTHLFAETGAFPYHADDPAIVGSVVVEPAKWRSVSIGIFDDGLELADITIPAGSLATWANRSATVDYRVRIPAITVSSGTLDKEKPLTFSHEEPLNPGQRFSQRFETPGDFPYIAEPRNGPGTTHNGTVHVVTLVEIVDGTFDAATVTVPAGSTVVWLNRDATSHTIEASDGSFTSPPLAQGGRFDLQVAGPVSYRLASDPTVTGTIDVVT